MWATNSDLTNRVLTQLMKVPSCGAACFGLLSPGWLGFERMMVQPKLLLYLCLLTLLFQFEFGSCCVFESCYVWFCQLYGSKNIQCFAGMPTVEEMGRWEQQQTSSRVNETFSSGLLILRLAQGTTCFKNTCFWGKSSQREGGNSQGP